MINNLPRITSGRTGRCSSWDTSGRNNDAWTIQPHESRVLADIKGPGRITHIWMTQSKHYRECLLRITWDNAVRPSVLVPLGDFFCLGHSMVNSFQSLLFTASTKMNNMFNQGCALNCYVPMPFRERAVVELVNESNEMHRQFFYIDYETGETQPPDYGYFHSEFRRANPFDGWGPDIPSNKPGCQFSNIANKGRLAWENNYVILHTRGCGHYIGCNLSVTNFSADWWGEGDDMIWVDGYKWPPDLHGTGTEDYLNHAWGMQDNAYLHNGSSLFEGNTIHHIGTGQDPYFAGGYQTSYVFHPENPVRFRKEISVTIEHGHGNHLANEISSTAYWYAERPAPAANPPTVEKRMPVLRDNQGRWLIDSANRCAGKHLRISPEMRKMVKDWKKSREKKR